MDEAPPRRRRRIGPRMTVGGIIALVALVYVIVIVLYAVSGTVEFTKAGGAGDTQVRLPIDLNPESVDPVANRMKISIELKPTGQFDGSEGLGLALSKPVTLIATDTDGQRALEFPADTPLSPVEVRMLTDGDVQFWPFDTYTVHSTVVAVATETATPIALDWTISGRRIPGWTFDVHIDELLDGKGYAVTMVAARSGATIAFGIVLLALMVVMPVIVLVVAINVYRGRRKMEATLMSWIAAMLFATIPLRGFLPGSPPIGSWIDYLVVLWVIAGLIAGLLIYVLAFLRWSQHPGSPPVAEGAAGPQATAPDPASESTPGPPRD